MKTPNKEMILTEQNTTNNTLSFAMNIMRRRVNCNYLKEEYYRGNSLREQNNCKISFTICITAKLKQKPPLMTNHSNCGFIVSQWN